MHAIARFLARHKGFIAFMLCMVVFRSAVADWDVVPTGSMQPTIRIGDRILVDKLPYDVCRRPTFHCCTWPTRNAATAWCWIRMPRANAW